MMDKVDVVLRYCGEKYVIGKVRISDNRDEKGREEEHELFGSSAVDDCLPFAREVLKGLDDPPIYLMVLGAVASAIRGGERDSDLEQRISTLYLRHHGLTAWMRPSNPLKKGAQS
jgi:hypothetical protein